jgi:hypothetical protein
MDLNELDGYNKELEEFFLVKRNSIQEITHVTCNKDNTKECLNYLEDAAFSPFYVLLNIVGHNKEIEIKRSKFCGRIYINYSQSLSYNPYPQAWNDSRIHEEICEIINQP